MSDWQDHYFILGVDRNATEHEIRGAYKFKAFTQHPDRLTEAPESIRRRAEEEFKKINIAYEILGDPEKREQYNLDWDNRNQSSTENATAKQSANEKPRPKVDPPYIYISDAEARKIKKASFVIINEGGPYNGKIDVNSSSPWIRIADKYHLDPNDTLPYKVDIEVQGAEWNQTYLGEIEVTLEIETIPVQVELKTIPKPEAKVKTSKYNKTLASPRSRLRPIIATSCIAGIILLSILVFHSQTSGASGILWDKTFRGSIPADYSGRSVQLTSDGGYIIVGSAFYDDSTSPYLSQGVWLLKADSLGYELWNRTIEGTCGYSIQQTSDGGYIITGSSVEDSNYNTYIFLTKTDFYGNDVWNKTFGYPYSGRGNSVRQTTDGGYIITGELQSQRGDNDVCLIKTDPDGNMVWQRTFDRDGNNDYGNCVQETSDGGYILAAGVSPTTPNDGYESATDPIWLIKCDPNGNKSWDQTYTDNAIPSNTKIAWGGAYGASYVQQTNDGGYIIVGSYDSRNTDTVDDIKSFFGLFHYSTHFVSSTHTCMNAFIIKIDINGNKLWTRILKDCSGNSIQQTQDGGYIIIGNRLIKTDCNGEELWSKTFESCNGYFLSAVEQTNDGGYIVTGNDGNYGCEHIGNAKLIKIAPP